MPDMNIDEMVGARVRDYRKAAGMGQETLATEVQERTGVGMSRTTVVRIERGERPVTVTELAALALTLNVAPAALVTPVERRDDALELTPKHTTTPARAYFWWTGLQPSTTPRGFVPDLAMPTTIDLYEAALRMHVTQRFYYGERSKLQRLEQLRAGSDARAPGDEDFRVARERLLLIGRQFVHAMQSAREVGLPPYRVDPEHWEDLALSVGRTDPVGWAQDAGIEAHEPEDER
jgi:transcriptional regulator with XRE-family HTH domain